MFAFVWLALAALAVGIPTITSKGAKFFTSDGNQFYIKGIAYQLTEDDPLIDGNQCQLDASLMKTLGTNAIRVYHVDASGNHDACMSAFSDAGIYVFVDLDTFNTYILPIDSQPMWNQTMYSKYSEVMDAFHNYDNTAGFFIGNEMLNVGPDSVAAPYLKASVRDMKSYRDSKGYRKIPIGYSATDSAELRPNLQNYLACGSNASETLDFFSLNAYEWCGQSSYDQSGYVNLNNMAEGYPVPIFFSETGCRTVRPRTFDDQAAILGSDMDGTWSGAIIYEWIEETNDYGLISYGPSVDATATGSNVVAGYTRAGTPTPISPDFPNLSSQWKTLTPSGVAESAYNPSLTAPSCPAFTSSSWLVSGNVPLPTLGQAFSSGSSSGSSSSGASSGSSPAKTSATPTSGATSSGSATGASASSATAKSLAARMEAKEPMRYFWVTLCVSIFSGGLLLIGSV